MLHFNNSRFTTALAIAVENGSRTASLPAVTKSAGTSMGASASVDQMQVICSDVERAVPRTPRGSRDVKHCDRDGLTDVISRAEQDIKAFYDAAWESCVADDLLAATAAFQADFPGAKPPPRCALPEGATVEALVALAFRSTASPSSRTAGASCPGRRTRRPRCGAAEVGSSYAG